jgi:hypothetical protein
VQQVDANINEDNSGVFHNPVIVLGRCAFMPKICYWNRLKSCAAG